MSYIFTFPDEHLGTRTGIGPHIFSLGSTQISLFEWTNKMFIKKVVWVLKLAVCRAV